MPSPNAKELSRWRKWVVNNQTKSFPELAALDDMEQRYEAVKAAGRDTWPTLFVMVGFVQPVIMFLTRDWFRAVDSRYYFLPFALYMFSFGFLLTTIPYRVHRKQMQQTIRQKINEFRIPVCMECGYHLKGITEPRCPECGQPFESTGPMC